MSGLVFVSTELAPYTDGGFGRLMFNMLRSMSELDRARTTLMMIDSAIDPTSFESMFPRIRLMQIDTSEDRGRYIDERQHPPASAYSNTPWHWRSAAVFRALADLNKSAPIEYLEFPDRGGLAFCTLQERHLTGFLAGAAIAVRLHMSHTALLHSEARPIAVEDLNLSDLERKCLRDSDYVVTPLLTSGDAARRMFGFSRDQWDDRVLRHAAPMPPEVQAASVGVVPASSDQAIALMSGLQRLERPELFVRAASAFLRTTPSFTGDIGMERPGDDNDYATRVKRLIPPDLEQRFKFTETGSHWKPELLPSSATVVLPGEFDSFCFPAYEASMRGARLIVNERNPAFGDGTPWHDGVNCLKFNGTVDGLARALERNLSRNEVLQSVEPPVDPWPWAVAMKGRKPWRALVEEPTVSIVVSHHNLGAYVAETIDNLMAQTYANIEVIVVDDASTDPHSIAAIDALVSDSDPRVRVIHLAGNVGLAAARNIGVRQAVGKYLLTLDADDLIHPRFVSTGVEALENNPEFDIVVTPAGYFIDGEAAPTAGEPVDFCDYAVFSGEAVVAGLVENRFSTATALFRKSALDRFPYLESLDCYEDWSLYMRMCDAGHRFIVTTDVYFFYRRRQNSMVHAPRNATRKRIEYSDLLRTSAPSGMREKSRQFLIGLGSPVAPTGAEPTAAQEAAGTAPSAQLASNMFGGEGGQFDEQVAFGALKISRWLERKAPLVVRGFVSVARGAWRAYRALRA